MSSDLCLSALGDRSFLQSRFWADFKTRPGVGHLAVDCSYTENCSTRVSVFIHQLVAGFSLAYVPHGPAIHCPPDNHQELLLVIARQIRTKLPAGCLLLRFDPAWYRPGSIGENDSRQVHRPRMGKPFVKAADVQPPDTVILDLLLSEDELLAGMKPKWRYNLKLAAKKGVSVQVESWQDNRDQTSAPPDLGALESKNRQAIDTFYQLYQATAERDSISLHAKSYYERLLRLSSQLCISDKRSETDGEPLPDVRVWVARHDGEALAAIITIFFGTQAVYLYGASSDSKRNLMPAYLLQWEAIKAAKAAGCLTYDFYGIPPVDDPAHPMAGLYRFKTGFGGQIRHLCGCWDYPLLPLPYRLYRLAEDLRLFWHKKLKKSKNRDRSADCKKNGRA